jgi:NAD(P)-dependent dehydrogenase (short-subunit alcohol dehydrogenase family)
MGSDLAGDGLAETAELLGEPHCVHAADLASEREIEQLVDRAVRVLGGLSVVVNCAAVVDPGGTVVESTTDALDRALAVNTRAPFLVSRGALRHMVERGSGSIVNVASILGLVAAPGFSPYAVSKIGMIQLTRQIAAEYAKLGIRCNAVCPGATRAAGEDETAEDLIPFRDAVGRLATPDEIADVVTFLASDRASFMNGSIVTADGGYTAQ